MKIRKLNAMPYAQAKVIEYDNGGKILVSYTTYVIYVTAEGWLDITGLYSATTRRHISAFMRELGLDYSLAKMLYKDGHRYNIYTGEVA